MTRWSLLLLAACGTATTTPDDTDPITADTDAVDPLALDPADAGPFRVGYRSATVTYAPTPGETREIVVHAWYPTLDTGGEVGDYSGYRPAEGTLLDAAPAPAAFPGGAPLWVHSHGDQAFGGAASFLFRHLAAHGWVVLSPDHTDNMLLANVQPTPAHHWLHRPRDLSASVDWLDALPAADPLAGVADTSRWVVSGHSRGGTTVWSLVGAAFTPTGQDTWCSGCEASVAQVFLDGGLADPRVAGGVLLATGLRTEMFGSAPTGVTVPMMLQTGTEDGDGGVDAWDRMGALDAVWVQLQGGCHETFSLGACTTLDVPEGFSWSQQYALAFGREALLADDNPAVQGLLDGTSIPDPRVTVQTTP